MSISPNVKVFVIVKITTRKTEEYVDGRMGSDGPYGDMLGVVEWIQLAQDRNGWRALVNTVMNILVLAPRIQLIS
jgi:hypothetical protein